MGEPRSRILLYCQHLLGIGHLIRTSRIAEALVQAGFQVTLVTGGPPVPGCPGPGVRHVALTPLRAGPAGFVDLRDTAGAPAGQDLLTARRTELVELLRAVRPHILITEAFPFGRRKMRFELLPLLEEAETLTPRPLIVCSVRDILQTQRKAGRAEETVALLRRHYDLVLVHGDPRFARLEESFALAGAIADRIVYTGLAAGPAPARQTGPFDVVVSAGGGAVGADLLQAALQARAATRLRAARWCLVGGPGLAQESWAALQAMAPAGVTLSRFRADLPQLMAGAQVSVSQAGYNTVCDLLRARVPAVVVPFADGGETEQEERARRLAERGLAVALPAERIDAATLAGAIERALDLPPPLVGLDLDGAAATARILAERTGVSACREA